MISVPVPATSEIFASSNVKFKQIDIDTELVTPTGAAIIAELAEEFNVTVRTIQNDIQALSLGFPIYTRQGGDGGIFVGDNYKPYMNTLTPLELKVLHEMYGLADGIHKKVLFQLIRKYGPDKLEL